MSTGLALSLLCAGDQVFGCCYTTSYSCCRQLSKHNTHNPLSLVTIHLVSPTRDSVVEELNDKDGLIFRWAASLLQVHGHHLEELSCVQLRALLFNDAHPARRLVVPPAAWYADAMCIAVFVLVEAKDDEVLLSRAPQGLHELYPR